MKFNGIPAKSKFLSIISGCDDPLLCDEVMDLNILSVVPLVDGRHLLVIYEDKSVNDKVADETVLKDKSDSDDSLSKPSSIPDTSIPKGVVTQSKPSVKKPAAKNTSKKKT